MAGTAKRASSSITATMLAFLISLLLLAPAPLAFTALADEIPDEEQVSAETEEPAEVEVEFLVDEDFGTQEDVPDESLHLLGVSSADADLAAQLEEGLSLEVQDAAPAYRDELKERLRQAFANMETSVKLSDLENRISVSDSSFSSTLKEVRREIIEEYPEYFWVSTADSWSFKYSARTYVTSLSFSDYPITAAQVAEMQPYFEAAVADAVSWATAASAADSAIQAKAVHDWLVRHCVYNKEALTKGGPSSYGSINPWTAYGALVDGKAYGAPTTSANRPVCQGYSYAFNAVMKQLGITSRCVIETESNGTLHMWNRTRLDGADAGTDDGCWYNVDVTHDDPLKAGTSADFGYDETPRATYFLRSDAYFRKTADTSGGVSYHKNFAAALAGTDTAYDSRSWSAYNDKGAVSSKKLSDATVTVAAQSYTGSALTPAPTVVYNGTTLKKDADYTVSYKNNTNAGTASLTVTGKGDYSGSKTVNFTISAASLSGATVTGVAAKAYTGNAITQSPTVKMGTKALANGTDYSLSYKNNTKAGTATVTVSGKGNYAGSISKSFTISRVSLATSSNVTVSAISDRAYNGKAQKPGIIVKLGGKELSSGTDYTVSYKNNTKAGTATATITGSGSCTGSVTRTFKITAFDLKGASISGISAKKYTGKKITQNVVVKIGGTKLAKGTDYTVSYKNNKKVGTATVIIKGKGSCTGTVAKKFKIKKK